MKTDGLIEREYDYAHELENMMETVWAGKKVYYQEETGSTNADVKHLAQEGAPHGTLVVAGQQTSGRGRKGNLWLSPAGEAVYMTLLIRPQIAPDKASMLTLVMALAVTRALEEETALPCMIKWPNDIVIQGKKVCGILTEMSASRDELHYVVIGAGINVSQDNFPEEIREVATSLRQQGKEELSKPYIIASVMKWFEYFYALFLETEDMSCLMQEYQAHLINLGKQVNVLDPQKPFTGIAKGITRTGELLVEQTDGTCETVYAGEVSVRGILGYV